MNILLTGGAGYIGSHAALILAQAGHGVVLYGKLCDSRRDVVSRLLQIQGRPVPLVEGDVRDAAALAQTLRAHAIDAVIHFAGLKAVGESVAKPLDYYANNVAGTVSLLQAMQNTGVRALFSASATAYGEPRYLPIDESHPTGASNSYGRIKLHAEEVLADLARSDPAWRITCLRYFNPVGAHESGPIGEEPIGVPNNLMPHVAQVAAGRRPSLNIFGDNYRTPDCTGAADYMHAMNLARGHLAALDFLRGRAGWRAFNLGPVRGVSILEMVRAFQAASGQLVPCTKTDRRPGAAAASYASTGKACAQLRRQAAPCLDEMCASTWRRQRR